jgi:hypothetical protein
MQPKKQTSCPTRGQMDHDGGRIGESTDRIGARIGKYYRRVLNFFPVECGVPLAICPPGYLVT